MRPALHQSMTLPQFHPVAFAEYLSDHERGVVVFRLKLFSALDMANIVEEEHAIRQHTTPPVAKLPGGV